jgi:UDP:flavonoid glycosyltransferase YjiC (YdhE family)
VKILFSSRPAYGHVYPLLPLAFAARDAGHDVSFATIGRFLPKLGRLGFPTHDIGVTIEHALGALTRLDGDGRAAPRRRRPTRP